MTDLRKIDALVAEHVFHKVLAFMSEHDVEPSVVIDQATAHFDVIPEYSSDIAAAWEVVEELALENRAVEVGNGHSNWWWCNIARAETDSRGLTVYDLTKADTAPLAICLAALKSRGIEP
jgi:hypothetical protein